MNDISEFGRGWAFFKSDGASAVDISDYSDWIKGFCAAMADYDIDGEYISIKAALVDMGVDGDQLDDCLKAAENVIKNTDWVRWPFVQIRD